MKKILILAALLMLALSSTGCAVGSFGYGSSYRYERIYEIREGMSAEEVSKILGKPYIVGTTPQGERYFEYSFFVASGGGVPFVALLSASGGTTKITFENNLVKKIQYEIIGNNNFDRFNKLEK